MNFEANDGKSVFIRAGGHTFIRHAIKTRFITEGDELSDVIREYVSGIYEDGDILSMSEKIVSICQHRLIKREDVKVGALARFLSRFADRDTAHGCGVGSPIKMQYAIDKKGAPRIIVASLLGGLFKLFGIKGVFYAIAGREVSGLDGFYDGVWEEYRDVGIELPRDPDAVCDSIRDALGISCMIVDANDLGQTVLGRSRDIKYKNRVLREMIRDNPSGQGRQRTPLILIRRVKKT